MKEKPGTGIILSESVFVGFNAGLFRLLSSCRPRFAADRGKSVTYCPFLRHFGGSHYTMCSVCKYKMMSRMCVVVQSMSDEFEKNLPRRG